MPMWCDIVAYAGRLSSGGGQKKATNLILRLGSNMSVQTACNACVPVRHVAFVERGDISCGSTNRALRSATDSSVSFQSFRDHLAPLKIMVLIRFGWLFSIGFCTMTL